MRSTRDGSGGVLDANEATIPVVLSGSGADFDVEADGVVSYVGVVVLIPTFYISVLGRDFNMPIVEVPVELPLADAAQSFAVQHLHLPLPDLLVTEVDAIRVKNGGEAPLELSLEIAEGNFALASPSMLLLQPNEESIVEVHALEGASTGLLELVSNDPDLRRVLVDLDAASPVIDRIGGTDGPTTLFADSCGCNAIEERANASALLLVGLLLLRPSSRRRSRPS
jgi:hypothetical protein